jgi:hypothetical protein
MYVCVCVCVCVYMYMYICKYLLYESERIPSGGIHVGQLRGVRIRYIGVVSVVI